MSIESRLLAHFGSDSTLDACDELVRSTFPDWSGSPKSRDVLAMARQVGLSVTCEATDEFDGRFETNGAGGAITLSSLAGRRRMRFTLAHELGHWLLRRVNTGDASPSQVFRGVRPESRSGREEERLADLLAAELLMPHRALRGELSYSPISLAFVEKTAKKFDVSFRAALRRVADVTGTPFLYLNVVPNKFRDLTTYAEVDDCWLAWPMQPMARERNTTQLVKEYAFDSIHKSRRCRVGVSGKEWRVLADFEVRFCTRPIPNCDLLTMLNSGVYRSC